jgi:hypothetical protein
VDATAEYGSFNTQRYALQGLLGQASGLNAVLDASRIFPPTVFAITVRRNAT